MAATEAEAKMAKMQWRSYQLQF